MKTKKRALSENKKFLKKQYKKCWQFLLESKNFIYFVSGLFFVFFILGYLFPIFFQKEIATLIEELTSKIIGKNAFQLISFIFFNNLKACVVSVLFGFLLGIVPFFIALVNGYLAGFVSHMAVEKGGIFVLWRLFPHGIFELPAVLLSVGIGIKLGMAIFSGDVKRNLREALRFIIFVILPLLLIAAIIEGTLIFLIKL